MSWADLPYRYRTKTLIQSSILPEENAYEVVISDDGVGFDTTAPKADDGRSHVGMESTHTRLKEMCGGDVKIESTVGEGTVATITLPKNRQSDQAGALPY